MQKDRIQPWFDKHNLEKIDAAAVCKGLNHSQSDPKIYVFVDGGLLAYRMPYQQRFAFLHVTILQSKLESNLYASSRSSLSSTLALKSCFAEVINISTP